MFHVFSQAAALKAKREERTGESKKCNYMFQVGFLFQRFYVSGIKYKNIIRKIKE